MKKTINFLAATVAAISLVFMGAMPASAETPATTMTYSQFVASSSYQAFLTADAASEVNLAKANTMKLQLRLATKMAGSLLSQYNVNVDATKTATKVIASMYMPALSSTPVTMVYGFANNSYYQEVQDYSGTVPNGKAALDRLKKSDISALYLDTTSVPEEMDYANPKWTFDGSNVDPLLELVNDETGYLFSEVTSSTVETKTIYSFTVLAPATGLVPAMPITINYTFDSTGTLVRADANGSVPSLNMTVEMSITLTADQVVDVAAPTDNLHLNTWIATGKKISAEKLVAAKAKSIASKAKALAGKKTLAAKNITDAAKSLKYTVTSVKNGVKLTAKYQNVSGSMCVVATKGVAVVSNC